MSDIVSVIMVGMLGLGVIWAFWGMFRDRKEPVGGLIYVASPFTSPSKEVERARYQDVVDACARMFEDGFHVMSPIAHCYPMFERGNMPGDFEFWRAYNYAVLSRCEELWVLTIDGWKDSKGVQGEIEFARKRGIPIGYVICDVGGVWELSDEDGRRTA